MLWKRFGHSANAVEFQLMSVSQCTGMHLITTVLAFKLDAPEIYSWNTAAKLLMWWVWLECLSFPCEFYKAVMKKSTKVSSISTARIKSNQVLLSFSMAYSCGAGRMKLCSLQVQGSGYRQTKRHTSKNKTYTSMTVLILGSKYYKVHSGMKSGKNTKHCWQLGCCLKFCLPWCLLLQLEVYLLPSCFLCWPGSAYWCEYSVRTLLSLSVKS